MIIQEIADLIAADTTVQALVSGRVYAGDVLPRGYKLPAALVHTITDVTDYTFGGSSPLNECTVQVDVYGDTRSDVGTIQAAVKAVLVNYTGTLNAGSIVTATYWKSDSDAPFSADVNRAGMGYRVMSKVCFYYTAAVGGGK